MKSAFLWSLVSLAAVLALAGWPLPALAHETAPAAGRSPWAWPLESWLWALLLLSASLYALGLRRLWDQAGRGRGIAAAQAASFAAGWLALAAALASPLDTLGGHLFSAHMVQHELLMLVAAPLMVLGRPLAAWTWALPPGQRRRVGGWFQRRGWTAFWSLPTDPLVAWALHALILWAWHLPDLFSAALRHDGLHILQHGSFLVSALLFWWAMLGRDPRGRLGPVQASIYLLTTMLHTGALGALLTFATRPWYAPYVDTTSALGLDPLEDQQLGGLIMWVPGALAYVLAALWVFGRLLVRLRA